MRYSKSLVSRPPIVLCIAGHDPTGGAGIVADFEAVAAQGAHALTLITALTVQDSRNVKAVFALPADRLLAQLEVLLDDCEIAAIKIGLLGAADQIPIVLQAVRDTGVPVVLDPVLRAGGGCDLVNDALLTAIVDRLLPVVTLATPNVGELCRLAATQDVDVGAASLLAGGCGNLLVTGGDEATPNVLNHWYAPGAAPRLYTWPRLPETFHGAGCTLASAIAARLALGDPLADALECAQRWTQQTLADAFAVGRGRRIPGRSAP